MKFLRYKNKTGDVIPCVLTESGGVHNLSSIVSDIGPSTLGPDMIEAVSRAMSDLPVLDTDDLFLAPPMDTPRNIWCVGLNYSDHAAEAGMAIPDEPILFNKSTATYCGPNDDILFSPKMTKLDWEVELGIVIGKPVLNITKDQAPDHIFGYVLINDVSERAWQLERGGQWVKGKSFPNFCPTGPYLVPKESVGDINNLDLWLDVNGTRMQTGSTSKMIFDVNTIVSYMSEFCKLEPGDLILTGTPPGVGAGMKPQRWLNIGDKVTLGITGLGEQSQTVVKM